MKFAVPLLLAVAGLLTAALCAQPHRDFTDVLNSDEVKAEAAKQGLAMRPSTAAQLGALIKSDLQRWQKVVTDHKITAD